MFLHVDLDAFFASVEQLDHPDFRGKPVIVGAIPGHKRGVVAAASYEARKFGVHSAMPIDQAYRLCPQGIYLPSNMRRYREKSQEVMAIFGEFSPDVQQMSIDEAFIDLTGTQRLFGPLEETAQLVKKRGTRGNWLNRFRRTCQQSLCGKNCLRYVKARWIFLCTSRPGTSLYGKAFLEKSMGSG